MRTENDDREKRQGQIEFTARKEKETERNSEGAEV